MRVASAHYNAAFTPQQVHATASRCINHGIRSYVQLNPDDDTTSGSNIVNPLDARRQRTITRQQSTADAVAHAAAAAAAAAARAAASSAPAASEGAQSVTATIDYQSLATAMSCLNDDSASNLEKGTQLKWDFKTETFVDWQHKVEILAESHDIRHLLEHHPVAAPGQLRMHEIAKRIILLTLPNHDRAYLRGSQTLNETWSKVQGKYMPSIDAEAGKLWSRFSALRQSGRPMVEHVNDCMTVRNLLEAMGETVPDKQFVDKLLNVDQELSYLRPMLVRAPIAEIVAGLTDDAVTTIKTVSTRTTPAMPEEAASSADTREGKVHLLLQRDPQLWQG